MQKVQCIMNIFFIFNSEPVSVRPSSVIGYNSGARTEDTYLGSYPFTFFYLESFS